MHRTNPEGGWPQLLTYVFLLLMVHVSAGPQTNTLKPTAPSELLRLQDAAPGLQDHLGRDRRLPSGWTRIRDKDAR